jgi:hypothetical protein
MGSTNQGEVSNGLIKSGNVTSEAFLGLVYLLHSLLGCYIAVVCLDNVHGLLRSGIHRTDNVSAHVIGEDTCIHHPQSTYTLHS